MSRFRCSAPGETRVPWEEPPTCQRLQWKLLLSRLQELLAPPGRVEDGVKSPWRYAVSWGLPGELHWSGAVYGTGSRRSATPCAHSRLWSLGIPLEVRTKTLGPHSASHAYHPMHLSCEKHVVFFCQLREQLMMEGTSFCSSQRGRGSFTHIPAAWSGMPGVSSCAMGLWQHGGNSTGE